jgi:hypothetical protein
MTFFFVLGLVMMVGVEVNCVLHPEPAPGASTGVRRRAARRVT